MSDDDLARSHEQIAALVATVVVGLAVEALVLAAGAFAAVTGGVALLLAAVVFAGVLAVIFFAVSEDAACVDTGLPPSRDAGVPARAGFTLRIAQGAAVLAIALVAGPAGLVAGYLGFYVVHGTANAVHYGMVHRLVGPEHRTTIVSANSLTSRMGGLVAAVGLGAIANAHGIPAACIVAAVVLAAAAPLYRIAGRAASAESAAEHTLAATADTPPVRQPARAS